MTTTIETPGFLTFTISVVVFFVGAGLNRWIAPLLRWNIPEAVTGGLLAALVTLVAHEVFGVAITFDLDARDMLLLYFFTGIGLNARLEDLIKGVRPFLVLLALTLVFLVIQNLIAAGSSAALGLPKGIAVLLGSASLIGGHGTTIAWAPLIEARFGLSNAMEIGVAAATLGLLWRGGRRSGARPAADSRTNFTRWPPASCDPGSHSAGAVWRRVDVRPRRVDQAGVVRGRRTDQYLCFRWGSRRQNTSQGRLNLIPSTTRIPTPDST
jgi:hypothetical protein